MVLMSKVPKVTWSQRKASLSVFVVCAGESGDPQLSLCDDETIYVKWGAYNYEAPFTAKVDHESADWEVGKLGAAKGTMQMTVQKAKSGPYWKAPFTGGKRSNVSPNWDTWIEEDEEVDEAEAAAAAQAAREAAAAAAEAEDPNGIPKRKKGGWKPTVEDWNKVVAANKPFTDDLKGRKIALSFSSKSADAKYAKELEKVLIAEGAECKCIAKWPVRKLLLGGCLSGCGYEWVRRRCRASSGNKTAAHCGNTMCLFCAESAGE